MTRQQLIDSFYRERYSTTGYGSEAQFVESLDSLEHLEPRGPRDYALLAEPPANLRGIAFGVLGGVLCWGTVWALVGRWMR